MNKNTTSHRRQVIPTQHNIEDHPCAGDATRQGILVPLALPELTIASQDVHPDGSLEVHVIATTDRATCPTCGSICVKVYDTGGRMKRDGALREHRVSLVLYKRRFRCMACRRSFTEPDSVCGRYKRTTQRFRDAMGKQASVQPIAQVADQMETGPRFIKKCLETWIENQLAQEGRSVSENSKLSTFVKWRVEILAFFQFLPTRISNGFVEGKNKRTKAIMRQAYGYRNRHHLRLRILLGNVG